MHRREGADAAVRIVRQDLDAEGVRDGRDFLDLGQAAAVDNIGLNVVCEVAGTDLGKGILGREGNKGVRSSILQSFIRCGSDTPKLASAWLVDRV